MTVDPAATLQALARHYRTAAAAPEPNPHDAHLLALAEHVEAMREVYGQLAVAGLIQSHIMWRGLDSLLAVAAAAGITECAEYRSSS